MIKNMKFSSENNSISVKYILPVRIVKCEKAENAEVLLKDLPAQAIRGSEPEVPSVSVTRNVYISPDISPQRETCRRKPN